MTTIWLTGAETHHAQRLFADSSVDRVAINIGAWRRAQGPKVTEWSLVDGFDPEEWVAWTDSESSAEDLLIVRDAMGTDPIACIGDPEWSTHPNYMELWNGDEPFPLSTIGSGLVVTDRVFSDAKLNRRVFSSKKRSMQIGAVTGKSRYLERYDFIISSAWWSTAKYGETQLWDPEEHRMHRVNKDNKEPFRQEHRNLIATYGVDVDGVLADEDDAVLALAIRSWQEYGNHLDMGDVLSLVRTEKSEVPNTPINTSALSGSRPVVVDTRTSEGRHVLPVLRVQEEVDEEAGSSRQSLVSTSSSLKQCNNCYLAQACPEFKPDASCAYEIPVQISNTDELRQVMQAVLEIQTQRVMENRFAEQILGQDLDPMVGVEMERLFRLTHKMRDIMDNRDSLSIQIDGKGSAAGGVLSKLFGTEVGENAKGLARPIPADVIVDEILE